MPIVLAAAVLIGALIVATDLSPAIEPAPGGVVLITVVIGILKVTLIVAAPLSCAWLWKASRRCFLAEPRLTLATDSRRPILYLRPFGADAAGGFRESDSGARKVISAALGAQGLPVIGVGRAATSEEAEFLPLFQPFGPVLAIGRPREHIPALGAPRLYIEHDHWQEAVRVFVHFAQLVIIRVGYTQGIHWELKHLRAECPARKLLVIFAPDNGRRRNAAIKIVEEALLVQLPPELSWGKNHQTAHCRAFLIRFSDDWQPICLATLDPESCKTQPLEDIRLRIADLLPNRIPPALDPTKPCEPNRDWENVRKQLLGVAER